MPALRGGDAGTVTARISTKHATEIPVKRVPRTAAALMPGVVLAGTAACSVETTPEPDRIAVVGTLPPDTDKEQSKKQAEAFRSWVEEHGTVQRKEAVGRVDRIIGEWNEHTGNACISTDIDGDRLKDPLGTATAIAEAFDDWKDAEQGYAPVYDVFGNIMIANHRF